MEKGLWKRLGLERWLEGGQEHSVVPRKGTSVILGLTCMFMGNLLVVVYGSGHSGAK